MQLLFHKRLNTADHSLHCAAADSLAAVNAILLLPLGAFLSLILIPIRESSPDLINILAPWQRPASIIAGCTSYYILGIFLSFLCAIWGAIVKPFAVWQKHSLKTNIVLFAYFPVLMAVYCLVCQAVVRHHHHYELAWVGLAVYLGFLWHYKHWLAASGPYKELFNTTGWKYIGHSTLSRRGYIFDLLIGLLIFVIVWPHSIEALSSLWVVDNRHIVSYLVGPALLMQVPGNLPNVNFFSQYSLALPYLFTWLLRSDYVKIIETYLYGMSACVILFCVLYYYLASRLYASRFWGFVFTLIMMILLTNALYWTEPSSSPLRFLFLPVCAIAILKIGLNNTSSLVLAFLLCAVSILNNTETGLYTVLSFGAVLFIISPSWAQLIKKLGLLLSGTVCYAPQYFVSFAMALGFSVRILSLEILNRSSLMGSSGLVR
jgi:hypothetical protein